MLPYDNNSLCATQFQSKKTVFELNVRLSFNVIAIHPRLITTYDLFEQIWIVVERSQHHLSDVYGRWEQISLPQFSRLKYP